MKKCKKTLKEESLQVNEIITEINEQISGFDITKDSDVVRRHNAEEYIKGYNDGLSNALCIVKRHLTSQST